ncbi:MAG: hypothetical protein ABIJ97_06875 [Bacteroidota bacterium]
MDINYEQVLVKLKERVTELVLLYERVNDVNLELKQSIDQIKNEKEKKEILIEELEKKNSHLEMAAALTGTSMTNNNGAKERIDLLVRDIDKCIALLNK